MGLGRATPVSCLHLRQFFIFSLTLSFWALQPGHYTRESDSCRYRQDTLFWIHFLPHERATCANGRGMLHDLAGQPPTGYATRLLALEGERRGPRTERAHCKDARAASVARDTQRAARRQREPTQQPTYSASHGAARSRTHRFTFLTYTLHNNNAFLLLLVLHGTWRNTLVLAAACAADAARVAAATAASLATIACNTADQHARAANVACKHDTLPNATKCTRKHIRARALSPV